MALQRDARSACYSPWSELNNAVQHSGCSRHKRKASPGSERGAIVYEPVYVPTPEVAAVMVARCDVLKVEAKALCGE